MLPHSSPQLGENRTDERGSKKNVTWKLPDIEKTANACSHRSISDRLIGGISSLPPLALRGPEGRGTRAISYNFNGVGTSADLQTATVFRPPSIGRPIYFVRHTTLSKPALGQWHESEVAAET